MAAHNSGNPLDRSQRLLIAAVLAAAGGYSGVIWFTGGGTHDGLSAVALLATAAYVALCRVQSTASLLVGLQSAQKPPLLDVALHFTALGSFIASLVAWMMK